MLDISKNSNVVKVALAGKAVSGSPEKQKFADCVEQAVTAAVTSKDVAAVAPAIISFSKAQPALKDAEISVDIQRVVLGSGIVRWYIDRTYSCKLGWLVQKCQLAVAIQEIVSKFEILAGELKVVDRTTYSAGARRQTVKTGLDFSKLEI